MASSYDTYGIQWWRVGMEGPVWGSTGQCVTSVVNTMGL